jgi:hypothetical protein
VEVSDRMGFATTSKCGPKCIKSDDDRRVVSWYLYVRLRNMQEARSAYQIRAGMKDAAARIDRLQYLGYACEESDLV